MRKFIVNVNGKAYDVEIEELSGRATTQQPMQAVAQPVAQQPIPAPTPAPAQTAAPTAAPANGTEVNAPMPGLILNLCVANGASVKKGDKVVVLEAMKMENDIVAPCDGKISFVVKKGDNVDSGATLAIIG